MEQWPRSLGSQEVGVARALVVAVVVAVVVVDMIFIM